MTVVQVLRKWDKRQAVGWYRLSESISLPSSAGLRVLWGAMGPGRPYGLGWASVCRGLSKVVQLQRPRAHYPFSPQSQASHKPLPPLISKLESSN